MSDMTPSNLQLTQAVLQRRVGADIGPHEPNVLLIEGIADRVWVADLGRQGLARVEEAMKDVIGTWRSSDAAAKAARLGHELTAAESTEGEARRVASALEGELAARLDAGEDTADVEDQLTSAKSDLARVAVRAGVLRRLLDRARSDARDRLRRSLETVRLKIHQEARQEHQTALRALEQIVTDHFPAVNRSGYVFSLTKSAEVTEHHLRLAGFDQASASVQQTAG
jgi:hypothetical protein